MFQSIIVPSRLLSSIPRKIARTTLLGMLDHKDEDTMIHGIVSWKT
jgi:hypothetical protein